MKAIRVHQFGDTDVLKVEETPHPLPGERQVLVRIKAIGINPVETYIRAGKYGPMNFPFTPGHEGAGVVETIGTGVKQFRPGDRVFTDKSISGVYAELALCEEQYVHRLPDRCTFQEGACMGVTGATAYRALFQRGNAIGGETVLVHGATGGVGTLAVQLARASGLKVIGSASSEAGKKYVLEQGAHHAVDHDVVTRLDEVKSLTSGAGFDLILETSAHKNLASDLPALARGGRVVVIGSRGKIEIDPRDTMSRESDIRGMMLYGATPLEHRQIFSVLTAALESGILRPVIGLELPLSDAARAHHLVIERQQFGKIVLKP